MCICYPPESTHFHDKVRLKAKMSEIPRDIPVVKEPEIVLAQGVFLRRGCLYLKHLSNEFHRGSEMSRALAEHV
jgi:hypothetical protein